MSRKNIVNIINFVRNVDHRADIDHYEPVINQIGLLSKHGMRGTFLLQYDALINPSFVAIFQRRDAEYELGAWLEIVKELCDDAGISWRGREGYTWDWHSHVGNLIGYDPKEREKLIDTFMSRFKNIYGYYPKSVGAWMLDAYTLNYLDKTYGIVAACICRDQWGTDGYTLWGGYYNQAYYPSINNMLCPAQSKQYQIGVPVFRMLGSDFIYQYDCGLDLDSGASDCQGVITLEPVYNGASGGGGNKQWVDWYLGQNFNGKGLAFSYTQIGQENSFGWAAMKDGLIYQFERLSSLRNELELQIITLAEAGEWFRANNKSTPATSIVANTDFRGRNKISVWYNCRNYRANIFGESGQFWVRDLFLFDEHYAERYLSDVCVGDQAIFDNLPVMDGNRWSGMGVRAGIFFEHISGSKIFGSNFSSEEVGESILKVVFETDLFGIISIECAEFGLTVTTERNHKELLIVFRGATEKMNISFCAHDKDLEFVYNSHKYGISLAGATFTNDKNSLPKISLTQSSAKIILNTK